MILLPDAQFMVLIAILANRGESTSHRVVGAADKSAFQIAL